MIDASVEHLVTLAQAAELLPRRRRGRKTSVSTLYRWSTIGCRGEHLETLQVGATRCTSREALQRFFEKLSGAQPAERREHAAPVAWRTTAQRRRAAEEAGQRLKELGA